MYKKIVIYLIIALIGINIIWFISSDNTEARNNCKMGGGEWVSHADVCLGVTPSYCEVMGGEYNTCGSACIEDRFPGNCPTVCEQYCELGE